MKLALIAALLGACVALSFASCPKVAYHSCIKEEKPTKCKAVEVCKDEYKEKCGETYCSYPYTCATIKKKECTKFLELKQKCEAKKYCKKVYKPCGDGHCGLYEDCVKETVCGVEKGYHGRKLMGGGSATATATAVNEGSGSATAGASSLNFGSGSSDAAASAFNFGSGSANAFANSLNIGKGSSESTATAFNFGFGIAPTYGDGCGNKYGKCGGEQLKCSDKYICVAREPCSKVVVKKCIKSHLKPGYDVCDGGYEFNFLGYGHGEKCGDDYCGAGYECADVYVQACQQKCGDSYCDYGYECVADEDECADYPYLSEICRETTEPACVPLSPYVQCNYKPPCETVYVCEREESCCGNEYCPHGYACAIDYKPSCDAKYYPAYGEEVVKKPVKHEPKYKDRCAVPVEYYDDSNTRYYNEPAPAHPAPSRPSAAALSSSSAVAEDDTSKTNTIALSQGKGEAAALGFAETENSAAQSASGSGPDGAATLTGAAAQNGGAAEADAAAEHFD